MTAEILRSDALHLPFAELDRKRALDDRPHVVGGFLAHGKADRMLRAAL